VPPQSLERIPMKKAILILVWFMLTFLVPMPVMAANGPVITLQPQNPHYPEYSVAIYSVMAEGSNLSATWYLEYQGITYNLSDNLNASEPWEIYAGSSYGASQDQNTFHFFFNGIESGLNGALIYCQIEDGNYSVQSDKATITVMGNQLPPQISVPAKVSAHVGEAVELRCIAAAPGNEQLTYIWYETHTGKLQDIKAISPDAEYSDFFMCDTGSQGTRYYVCSVQTSTGGMAYSSVIPVTVIGRPIESKVPESTTESLPEVSDGKSCIITSAAVTGIEEPKTGELPDYIAFVSGEGYEFLETNDDYSFCGITWYDLTQGRYVPIATKFVAGHEYEICIDLVAESSYQFQFPKGTIDEYTAEVFGNEKEIRLCLIYPPCEEVIISGPAAAPAEPEKPKSPTASQAPSSSGTQQEKKPSVSGTPAEAEKPSASGTPAEAEKPSASGTPVQAEKPSFSGTSAEAEKPSASGSFVQSEKPTVPEETAQTEQSAASKESAPVLESSDENTKKALWSYLLIALAAAGAGVGITLLIIQKKYRK